MKHVNFIELAGETPVKLPTRRALAKQQTRMKVLAAARRLFSEHAYEGATIRDIAAAAGMSTGAVFANFSDKSDLFREIMISDMGALAERMREAAAKGRNLEDALLRVFCAGYGFYMGQLPLARAAFSVSWAQQGGEMIRNLPSQQGIHDLLAELLTGGVEGGELGQEAEVKLRAQMLFDAYLSNFPRAIFEGWSLEALQARSREQIRILLAGARRA